MKYRDHHTERAAKDNGVAYFEVTPVMREKAKWAAFVEHYTSSGRVRRDPPHQFIKSPWSKT